MRSLDRLFTRLASALLLHGASGALLLSPAVTVVQQNSVFPKRPIPSTGEKLPAVGLYSGQTFDVGTAAGE